MSDRDDISEAVSEILHEMLSAYDARVPVRSKFPDLRGARNVYFGDPSTSMQGRVELAVMHMDAELDREFDSLRFLAIRVWKSRQGGTASTTCFHATRDELKQELKSQSIDPAFIVDRIVELANGLPEETNPDVWR